MNESNFRPVVLKRHPSLKGYLVLCDEETGLPLGGQIAVEMKNCVGDGAAMIHATFGVVGDDGVRLAGDEPRNKGDN
ncbi:hypothetical protein [Acinetobacter nosocomialis]|uniref:hypothetical protein n=1 Tax=Acinetobacter nosocomialis TaxID=106654 RepID=UPI001A9ADB1C|nr:hypothetical protein [Acinetobacter nosocomialis]MBO1280951.1 hypothetical protein [Acinetobacter nosocomialis]